MSAWLLVVMFLIYLRGQVRFGGKAVEDYRKMLRDTRGRWKCPPDLGMRHWPVRLEPFSALAAHKKRKQAPAHRQRPLLSVCKVLKGSP